MIKWKPITIAFDSYLFDNVYLNVIKQITYPQKEMTFDVLNIVRSQKLHEKIFDSFKLCFDYPNDDDSIIGIETFKKIT